MVSVIATLPIREEKLEEFLGVFKDVMAKVAEEPGAVLYTASRAKDDPNTIVVMERYKDMAAFDAHSDAPYLKELFAQMPEFLAGQPQVKVMEEFMSI